MKWTDEQTTTPLLSWGEYIAIEFCLEGWHSWKDRCLIGLAESEAFGPVWQPPRVQAFGRAVRKRGMRSWLWQLLGR